MIILNAEFSILNENTHRDKCIDISNNSKSPKNNFIWNMIKSEILSREI